MYGPSKLGWNFSSARLPVFSKTLLKTNSPARNVRNFARRSCKFSNHRWHDVIHIVAASRSSSFVFKSLAMALAFAFS